MQQEPFLFGAGTSAHQVEGGNRNNDWWAWEQTRPAHLRSGRACDQWNRYEEDIALAAQLGHSAHRISLEWSRIEPVQGSFSRAAIEHYRNVLLAIRGHGMKPFVTLHHFTNPLWVSRFGGWESSRTPELFSRYAAYVAQHLGDLVDFWVTINEPMVYASQSYAKGVWPPQKKSWHATWRVVRNLAKGHIAAYRAIHRALPHARVGIAKHVIAHMPFFADAWFNRAFFLFTKNTHDFIGINYYFTYGSDSWAGPRSDMGWPIIPGNLIDVILSMRRYKKPIYITENGLADARDALRADFIRSHLRAVEEAQRKGADVRGYLHWSLIDNFEWADGFAPRFGLVAVDYETMQRTVRPSAYVYRAIIRQARDR